MDLPLLRNIYSVLFAKCESELLTLGLTRGRACWGGSPKLQPPFLPHSQRLWPQTLGDFFPLW